MNFENIYQSSLKENESNNEHFGYYNPNDNLDMSLNELLSKEFTEKDFSAIRFCDKKFLLSENTEKICIESLNGNIHPIDLADSLLFDLFNGTGLHFAKGLWIHDSKSDPSDIKIPKGIKINDSNNNESLYAYTTETYNMEILPRINIIQ